MIAATGVGIMLSARIAYGIASHRALPSSLANVSPRFKTPVIATVVAGVILLVIAWVYLLTTSVQNAFSYVLNNTGILYATFYCITALSAIVYYRRRVFSTWTDFLTLGILPVAAIVFLAWIAVKSIQGAGRAELLAARLPGRRRDPDAHREVRAPVAVLQDQAGELDAGYGPGRGLTASAAVAAPGLRRKRNGAGPVTPTGPAPLPCAPGAASSPGRGPCRGAWRGCRP